MQIGTIMKYGCKFILLYKYIDWYGGLTCKYFYSAINMCYNLLKDSKWKLVLEIVNFIIAIFIIINTLCLGL